MWEARICMHTYDPAHFNDEIPQDCSTTTIVVAHALLTLPPRKIVHSFRRL